MFQVGQKVVCVRDSWGLPCDWEILCPVAGQVYTIRTICDGLSGYGAAAVQTVGLRFHEIVNAPAPFIDGVYEPGFCTRDRDGVLNFRPVTETKTDISVFKRMLTPHDEKVGA